MELKIQDLCKSYGKKKALWNFTTEFENGIYGILGPNGAGKSTLMNILTDNLLRDSGSVLYDGAATAPAASFHLKVLSVSSFLPFADSEAGAARPFFPGCPCSSSLSAFPYKK